MYAHPMWTSTLGPRPESDGHLLVAPGGSHVGEVRRSRPLAGFLEQVGGFVIGDSSVPGGRAPVDVWWEAMQAIPLVPDDPTSGPLYIDYRAIKLNANIWLDINRCRMYIVYITEEAGGQLALENVCNTVQTIVQYRKTFPPTPMASLLASLDIDDATRSSYYR